jgi:hypothetical protein
MFMLLTRIGKEPRVKGGSATAVEVNFFMDQYHHYIPRFLLRNFAIDKYERIFESNIKQQKKKSQKSQKNQRKAELLQLTIKRKINWAFL